MPAVQDTIERVRKIDVDQYKYGFETLIEMDKAPKGLNEDIVRLISAKRTWRATCTAGGVRRLSMTVAPLVAASSAARVAETAFLTDPESVTVLPLDDTWMSSSGMTALMSRCRLGASVVTSIE